MEGDRNGFELKKPRHRNKFKIHGTAQRRLPEKQSMRAAIDVLFAR